MGDATFEDRVARIVVVKVHRVPVGRDLRKELDIMVGDELLQRPLHADLEILDDDGSGGDVVEHVRISMAHGGLIHRYRGFLQCGK
jgi:hypothetical protein